MSASLPSFHTVTELPLQNASLDIWETKYRLKTKNGDAVDQDIDATYQRVAKALAAVEKTKDLRKKYYQEFLWVLRQGAIPAGRIISNAGAEKHKPATSTINCFAYETPVLTDKGVFSIGELANKKKAVNVLNGNGNWSSVMFESHGKQAVHTLAFKYADNKAISKVRATKNHRWILKSGSVITSEFWLTTSKLKSFKKIANIIAPSQTVDNNEYKLGVLHGATYGDGSLIKESRQRYNLHLIGNKLDIIPFLPNFIGEGRSYDYVNDENQRFTFESEIGLKELPNASLCSYSYLKGFFAGILATDGSIHSSEGKRSVALCVYGSSELMDFLGQYLPILGITITHCKKDFGRGEFSNYGERKYDVFRMNIHPSTVDINDVLRSFHLKHFYQTDNGAARSKVWTFVNISDSVEMAEVYCCTEPETGSFCLFHGLLTGNCTVSGVIEDSMDDILSKVHEAGLTLKSGAGIGYEFSTLRPKDAYVSGAGAYTSGPLSFMDIYDKMCFTVSSAGGRRGAQMATFDICHPDVIEFIRAKREDGRLRQFNLSLLITSEFIEAVKNKADWPLSFPVTTKEVKEDNLDLNDAKQIVWRELSGTAQYVNNSDGLVACKIIKTIPAQRLWDIIMSSTYDYAEPGFILIDEANKMNNNWFCESLRTSNPCVTADTWVQTEQGAKQVSALLGQQIQVLVDGKLHLSGVDGFFKTATKKVVKLITKEGFSLRLTDDHRLRKITNQTRLKQETQWCPACDLKKGDKILLNNHREFNSWKGKYTENQGYLIGLLMGDGALTKDKAVLSVWKTAQVANIGINNINAGGDAMMEKVLEASKAFSVRYDFKGWTEIKESNEYRLSFSGLKDLTDELGMSTNKVVTPEIESASSDFYQGFLQGFFDADASVQGTQEKGVSVRLAQSDLARLEAVQRMLLRLGIKSSIYRNHRPAGIKKLPNGKGGHADYQIKAQHELVISGDNLISFQKKINFTDTNKALKLKAVLNNYKHQLNRERFTVIVEGIIDDGVEDVFDIHVPGIHTFDANGLHAHNCGEQILPPYGSCLLGSINLTRFVKKPFTDEATFDWATYRKVIRIFTRMLDNVVEINGLPLEKQREEIISKRRHGMGYLGLGSTVTMLRMKYGDEQSLQFTDEVTKVLAIEGWKEGLALAKEKGVAPILEQIFTVTGEMLRKRPEMAADSYKIGDKIAGKVLHAKYSRYMQRIAEVEPELVEELIKIGARFTHATSIAPTGTISLSLANNASNGIEPSFAHHYSRNVIREGKKSKEKVDVYSFELLAYRALINPEAMPYSEEAGQQLPDYFISADSVTPKQHVDVQAAAQQWIDSSISKTANVPTDYPYEDFKDIYQYAYEKGLKGCTTFRFNPEVFQGVLVKETDLKNTVYEFTLEDGTKIELKGNEEVEYDGEIHSAANLFDALKEGYYGKF